ncbi:geranylgeranylglycerol-phosphate geranylgeranyltransferase [Patiriisocius hiemis]|uniref:Geranylgeranylglycerol-phosphate geranylgeranyltransferase n=1 Tax=Patiriisocius hiemis TaxID=3075604 RepID=A0ABU2Y9Y7_9FLAO|nr:geranylgeranylglycerol-phosphate geranylgeranyltransferase [Constantimarinum sp. W242]MDT0555005.1 geranylgeranylglycerol-phosphate geranylgeranyltransferase [Constantimarinum sp. W242]
MISYFKIIRPINLMMIAITMVIAKYGFIEVLQVGTALSPFYFFLLVFSTICIAAGGYVINDSYDVEIDKINKPKKVLIGIKISQRSASVYYVVLTLLGVVAGFIISNHIEKPAFSAYFIIIAALLYSYASNLKSRLLIGNILISILVGMTLITIVLFDILPAINIKATERQMAASSILLYYAGFSFYINLIRELVKDLQDINGDKNGGRNTLAIVLGRKRTTLLVFVLGLLAIIGLVTYTYTFLYQYQFIALYFLGGIVAPLIIFCIKSWSAESEKDYKNLSILAKAILFIGMLSLLFYPQVLT